MIVSYLDLLIGLFYFGIKELRNVRFGSLQSDSHIRMVVFSLYYSNGSGFVFRAFCASKEDQLQHMMNKDLCLPLLLEDLSECLILANMKRLAVIHGMRYTLLWHMM